jgi:hypothetical protein
MDAHKAHACLSVVTDPAANGRAAHPSSPLVSAARVRRGVHPADGRPAHTRPAPTEVGDPPRTPVPLHRTLIGVDITRFGARDEDVQNYVRQALYSSLQQAFCDAGLPWPASEGREDRGDGVMLTVPPDIPTHQVIDPLALHLHACLRRHNKMSSDAAQILLRMVVHAGYVYRDDHGFTGLAIVELYRLLDAPAFKDAVLSHCATLGLLVSQYIYANVVQNGLGLIDPNSYTSLFVVNKETSTEAWLCLLHRPHRQAGGTVRSVATGRRTPRAQTA